MKKIIKLSLGVFLSLVFSITVANAASPTPTGTVVDPDTLKVTDETLDSFDPLLIGESDLADELSTPAGIINQTLSFIFPIAGMILFVMIVVGGFQMLLGGSDQKALQAGQQRITMALVGFILLFSSYWIVQILEGIFNIKIL